MKATPAVLLCLIAGAAAPAADLPGFAYIKGNELKGYEQKLRAKMDKSKTATQNLERYGNHLMMVAHREANGQVEVHEHTADVFVVESGEATLLVGGKADGLHTTAPGEVRAPSMKGGESRTLTAGDVVHIPAKMTHQLMVEPGKQITYFVVKVETPGK